MLLDKLDQLRFCQGMPAEYLRKLASVGELQEYPPGASIFREGQSSAHIYLVREGQVTLEVTVPGREATQLQVAGPGDLLGWSPVLGLGPMTASARSLTRCRVVALHAPRIVALGEDDPRFLLEFVRRTAVALAARLNATRRELLEVYRDDAQAVS